MTDPTAPAPAARQKFGSNPKVLLVVDSAQLLLHMTGIVRSVGGMQLAGAFTTEQAVVDWTLWDRSGWHYAFVDLGLSKGSADAVVRHLLSRPHPGTIVALGDHLWQEIRERCAAIGVYHLLEKGDLVAYRGFLEEQVR